MLKELASISIGMLVFGGHITDTDTLRRIASRPRTPARVAQHLPRPHQRSLRKRDWNGSLETVALAMTAGGSLLCVAFAAVAMIGGQPL